MALGVGDIAELAILLKLKDEVTGPLKSVSGALAAADKQAGKLNQGIYKVGAGIGVGIKSAAAIGAAAIGGLIGIEAQGLRSLEEQQRIEAQTAAVIKSTGGAAHVSVAQVKEWAQALSDANAVDELAVQNVENLLLTFRSIGGPTVKTATQAVLDMSRALGTDTKSAAIQLGKALDNPILGLTALRRVGVSFTQSQIEQIKTLMKQNNLLGAQKIILAEVNKEFGGSGSAFSQTAAGKIATMKDKWEELTRTLAQASLPAVTAIADGLSRLFADPAVQQGAQELGQAIAGLFSPKNIAGAIDFVRQVLPSIKDGLRTTLSLAKQGLDLFMSLPPEVKSIAIAALVGNKLTGGLVASGIGDIAKAGLGALFKNVATANMNVEAANVNVAGGGLGAGLGGGASSAEGAAVAGASTGSKVLGAVKILGAVALAGVSIAALAEQFQTFLGQRDKAQSDLQGQVDATKSQSIADSIANLDATIANLNSMNPIQRGIANTFGGGQITQDIVQAAQRLAAGATTHADLVSAQKAITDALNYSMANGLTDANAPLKAALDSIDQKLGQGGLLGNASSSLKDAITSVAGAVKGAINPAMRGAQPGVDPHYPGAVGNAVASALRPIIARPLDALHRDFKSGIDGLIHATKSADIRRAADKIARDIEKGVGNAKNTQATIDRLRTAQAAAIRAGDKELARALGVDIRKVETKLPNRRYVEGQLDTANKILGSSKNQAAKLAALERIQSDLRAHGDTHAAAKIQSLQNTLRAKKLAVTVNEGAVVVSTNVSASSVSKAISTVKRYRGNSNSYGGV